MKSLIASLAMVAGLFSVMLLTGCGAENPPAETENTKTVPPVMPPPEEKTWTEPTKDPTAAPTEGAPAGQTPPRDPSATSFPAEPVEQPTEGNPIGEP
jgi:hypothetical protein